ncbi:MAG: hypothetical protein CMJ45_05105 [Planctomyces sp.]|jgi:hypothetical protein|nr:hypothetical protein [Planctomyces sp.]MDP7276741.1 hypothetical protein [Planctomycetaceae bacterium]
MPSTYRETFDDGPGGWYGWDSNFDGEKPLELSGGSAISRSPWWIDYNHAPPGAGYMHLLYMLDTQGGPSERKRSIGGDNHFVQQGFGTNFVDAELTLRLKGELLPRETQFHLLCQGVHDGICTGWLLTGQPIPITPEWSEVTIQARADIDQWTCLGSRHDRTTSYGRTPLDTVLADVNADILLVLFPLDIAPMGPLDGDPHQLRPDVDYPVWRHRLPEGYVALDEVRIQFP